MAEVNYQSLLSKGAYQVTGYVTYGSRIPTSSGPGASEKDILGYIDASGKFQFNPYWSVSGSIRAATRSEEHTSELQSLMRISYAVFCLKKKHTPTKHQNHTS